MQANRSAVTPILQGIQGRRTGLIMAKRVSKDSDGFEDIDAFWDMASGALRWPGSLLFCVYPLYDSAVQAQTHPR